jgi:hypothetical protein
MTDPASETFSRGRTSASSRADELLADLRRCWRAGDRVLVEGLLQGLPVPPDEELLDFIYQEIVLREEAGETPRLEEYLSRFPHLAAELRLQFEVDRALQAPTTLVPGSSRGSGTWAPHGGPDAPAVTARSAERRKRRWLMVAAAVVLAAAVVGGLLAVLLVQRRAHADRTKNKEPAQEQAKVEKRFELAQKAIAKPQAGVSADMLLKNDQFNEFRT